MCTFLHFLEFSSSAPWSGLRTISVLGRFSYSLRPTTVQKSLPSSDPKKILKNFFFTLFFEATFNTCGFSVLKIFMNFRISRERRELSRGHVANISQWDGSRNIGRQLKMGWKRLFDLILAHY